MTKSTDSMFRRVIIDDPTKLSDSERQLTSFFFLLSDHVDDAYIIEMNEANWIDKDRGKYDSGYGRRWFPKEGEEIRLRPNDELVYSPWNLYEPGWGMSSGSSFVIEGEFIYTKKEWIKDAHLIKMGVSARTSILLLAAAGLEFTLPKFSLGEPNADEVSDLKQKLHEEREAYLRAVSKLANESFDRINSGAYRDAVEWARNESEFHINPKVAELELALSKQNKTILKRLAINFIRDGIPSVGKALMADGIGSASKILAEESLKLASNSLATSIEHRRAPEASYCVKLRESFA
jgi:hypothetical protein